MPYTHLTPMERGQIQAFVFEGKSRRAIARFLGRSPSTISRELRRHAHPTQDYEASRAQQRYLNSRKECRRTSSLDYLPLRRYLFDKMSDAWSPEQVSGRLWLDFPGQPRMRVSHETIYRALYSDEKLKPLRGCLRQRRPRRRRKGERRPVRPMIPNRVGIEDRPDEVDSLARYGDWEGDLIIGAGQQGAVVTLVERKSLLIRAWRVTSRHAALVAQAIITALKPLPAQWLNTITFDNGSEFAHHGKVGQTLGVDIYFAHPYAAYERGRNENLNGLLRQYLPKASVLKHLCQKKLQRYIAELNNRPRKKLSYRTPLEVFNQQAVALEP